MLVTAVMSIGLVFLSAVLSLASVIQLPTEAIGTLSTITGVASWIVGKDLLLLIFSNIIAWYGLRLGVAVIKFAFELKP